jgi:hypothetical protein
MLNKVLIVCLLYFFYLPLKGQELNIEKNNSLEKISFKLPKKMKLEYVSDSILLKQKVKVIDYNFPYLMVIDSKKDTLFLNVQEINSLKISSPIKNTFLVISTVFLTPLTLGSLGQASTGSPGLLFVSALGAFCIYKSVNNLCNKYDTKTKWSFY